MDVETHQAVFQWVLGVLAEKNLVKGTTIGVDATTLEANAALRSIVRREMKDGRTHLAHKAEHAVDHEDRSNRGRHAARSR